MIMTLVHKLRTRLAKSKRSRMDEEDELMTFHHIKKWKILLDSKEEEIVESHTKHLVEGWPDKGSSDPHVLVWKEWWDLELDK